MKKKIIALMLIATMVASVLVGCGGKKEEAADAPATEEAQAEA